MTFACSKCAGEGAIYTSKHGGNDPDVWRIGDCEECEGTGTQKCESRGCSEDATFFNDEGEALCGDCLLEWTPEIAFEGNEE